MEIENEQVFDCNIVNNLMYLSSKDQTRLKLDGAKGKIRLAFIGMVDEKTETKLIPYKK